jgi:hypothetical protein
MFQRNRWQTMAGVLVAAVFVLVLIPQAALAQDEQDPPEDQTVSQTATAPPPPAKAQPDPGPFAKGKVRVGLYAGAGSTYDKTYFILGAGVGYYLLNGLEAGVDLEGWLFSTPDFWKVTPQIRYVVWQMSPIRPYVGAFWRKTFVESPYPDWDSWGGRAGVAYRRGGNYLAVGVVYEKYNDYQGLGDDYSIYPEFAFWLSF